MTTPPAPPPDVKQPGLRPPRETVEHCNLCEAVLELSVENPRRVCGKCGSVNLPNVEVPVAVQHRVSIWLAEGLGAGSRPRWRAHGIALGVQLSLALLAAWGLGSGDKFDWGLLFVFLTFIYFCVYALLSIIPVFLMRKTWQVVAFDVGAPLLVLLAISLRASPHRLRYAPDAPVPVATARPPAPVPPAPKPPPRPRAPDAPGWEGSALLASFKVTQDGEAFTLRFVPHFTGTLDVSTRSPFLADVVYGRATCAAKAEVPAECVLTHREPHAPSAVGYELSGRTGGRPVGSGTVTVVRVDASGNGQPR